MVAEKMTVKLNLNEKLKNYINNSINKYNITNIDYRLEYTAKTAYSSQCNHNKIIEILVKVLLLFCQCKFV